MRRVKSVIRRFKPLKRQTYSLDRGLALIEVIIAIAFLFIALLILLRILSIWFPLFSLSIAKVALLAFAAPFIVVLYIIIAIVFFGSDDA